MSEEPAAVAMFCLLRDHWWPHPVHGEIAIQHTPHLLVFHCCCGERFGIPMVVAHDLGLITPQPEAE